MKEVVVKEEKVVKNTPKKESKKEEKKVNISKMTYKIKMAIK